MYRKIYTNIHYNDIDCLEKKAIDLAITNIQRQTAEWHINSDKRVAAVLYCEGHTNYFSGQNIGISKVTGTLCAERTAIANLVANNPTVQLRDVKLMVVVAENGPILPCGVCCEWLYKMNPEMTLLTIDRNTSMTTRIKIKDYYGDETLINNRGVVRNENKD